MFTILQLSDLHFGTTHYFRQDQNDPTVPTLADAVTRTLSDHNYPLEFDRVILSGDFFSNEATKEFFLAKDMCRELIAKLSLPAGRILCVPGNHDLTWDEQFKAKFRFYDDLMEAIGAAACKRDSLPAIDVLPPRPGQKKALAIVLLDSDRVEGKDMAGIGKIGDDQLTSMERKLKQAKIALDSHNIIAVLHHHLLPISPEEDIVSAGSPQSGPVKRVSLTVDAVDVLRRLTLAGVSLVLHGHQHRAAGIKHRNLLIGSRAIHVLAAGSCGGSSVRMQEDFQRHFYLHRIADDWAETISFQQSGDNPREFEPVRTFRMTLPSTGCECQNDDGAVPLNTAPTIETGRAAGSDLKLLLLSVVDCPESRRIINSFFVNYRLPTLESLRLVAMYDLLGKWDLAVKFRLRPAESVGPFLAALRRELEAGKMLDEQPEIGDKTFAMFDWIEVASELPSLDTPQTPGEVNISRVWLSRTEAYEKSGYGRGFIYIDVKPEHRDDLCKRLRADLASENEARGIIEAVLVGSHAIVLDVLMKPKQSNFINRLNRAVEPALTRYHSQKYTLLCYAYDERTLT